MEYNMHMIPSKCNINDFFPGSVHIGDFSLYQSNIFK